jgi:hypothetical protein
MLEKIVRDFMTIWDHDRSDQQSRCVCRSGEHCETGGREVFFQKMFGWLDPIIAG